MSWVEVTLNSNKIKDIHCTAALTTVNLCLVLLLSGLFINFEINAHNILCAWLAFIIFIIINTLQ